LWILNEFSALREKVVLFSKIDRITGATKGEVAEQSKALLGFEAEGWLSGRRRRTRNAVSSKGLREFESHPFRFATQQHVSLFI